MIKELFQNVNGKKGSIISLNVASIVKGEAQSSLQTYPVIKNALFTGIEGRYPIDNTSFGHIHYEGISKNGLLINFEGRQQLFISEEAKFKKVESKDYISFDIKDPHSSMYIQLQMLIKKGATV